jgi:hypothetical protein
MSAIHKEYKEGSALCGTYKCYGVDTTPSWGHVTCKRCLKLKVTPKELRPVIIHMKNALGSLCGIFKEGHDRYTYDLKECNCQNCNDKVTDKLKDIDLTKAAHEATAHLRPKVKLWRNEAGHTRCDIACYKAVDLDADMQAVKQYLRGDRIAAILLEGLQVKFKALRTMFGAASDEQRQKYE